MTFRAQDTYYESMPDFLTIDKAMELTGKSASTILRFVRKNKGDNSIVQSELIAGHWQYRINADILDIKYPRNTHRTGKEQAETGQEHPTPSSNDEMLRSVIQTLQEQLKEKDKTIQALINNNHQLSGVIAQLQLPAPEKRETPEKGEILSGKEETEKKHASNLTNKGSQNKETGKSSSKERKKKSVIARIFSHKLF